MRYSDMVVAFLLVFAFSVTAATQPPSNIWDALADDPHWSMTDPTYLYLVFRKKDCPGDFMTWLHSGTQESNAIIECFMPGHEREARAFVYHLSRETAEGYEVTFQPMDPKDWLSSRPPPVNGKETKIFFSRTERKLFTLTDQLSVAGFYGSPKIRRS